MLDINNEACDLTMVQFFGPTTHTCVKPIFIAYMFGLACTIYTVLVPMTKIRSYLFLLNFTRLNSTINQINHKDS